MYMKRYVIEFANDILNQDKENTLMQPKIKQERKACIDRIINVYKLGLITSMEAIKAILES